MGGQVIGTPDEDCRTPIVLKEQGCGVRIVILRGHLEIALLLPTSDFLISTGNMR